MINPIHSLSQLLRKPKSKPGGCLLIKRWGAGFWSDVDMVVTYLLVAEVTKRTPVVHWGTAGPYANGHDETFELYFEPVSEINISELKGSIYPKNWNENNILNELPFPHTNEIDEKYGMYHLCSEKRNIPSSDRKFNYLRRRQEDIVVAYCWEYADRVIAQSKKSNRSVQDLRAETMRTKLKLRPELRKEILRYFDKEIHGREVLGVHMRGSDKVKENSDLHRQNKKALKIAMEWVERSENHYVYLATDSENYASRFKECLGAERIIIRDCLRSDEEIPNFLKGSSNGYQNGYEIVLDTYIASMCREFVGNSTSNVANFVVAIGNFQDKQVHWVNVEE